MLTATGWGFTGGNSGGHVDHLPIVNVRQRLGVVFFESILVSCGRLKPITSKVLGFVDMGLLLLKIVPIRLGTENGYSQKMKRLTETHLSTIDFNYWIAI